MITKEFIQSLELSPEKAEALQTALRKEDFYRAVLYKTGIPPKIIPSIMKTVDTATIDESKEALYIERATVEWGDLIPKRNVNTTNNMKVRY